MQVCLDPRPFQQGEKRSWQISSFGIECHSFFHLANLVFRSSVWVQNLSYQYNIQDWDTPFKIDDITSKMLPSQNPPSNVMLYYPRPRIQAACHRLPKFPTRREIMKLDTYSVTVRYKENTVVFETSSLIINIGAASFSQPLLMPLNYLYRD